ncbi:hypothetical protein C2I18_08880 [Paenibacillus sp. PK3_47]|uniref:DUF488 domain-containing protein n=1 Tax=Paenibacillus sp. PK3_47 TaxID=2072642 RepID=UPI00201D6BED|nr:DUF488 domain-containing protein [Paenibacillus sp. PK3_47]UQZ33643.1 hypothetical protein C2I18_08880 [Paenibacillus sp. PK3_47]
MSEVCTIGFAKKSLKGFVDLLQKQNVKHLIDTRLNNTSQLSGFAKKDDLSYVMDLVGIKYSHKLNLAPDKMMLDDFKKKKITWEDYEQKYIGLLKKRKIEQNVEELLGDGKPCFLCSEDKPHHCHRRLLVEYLKEYNRDINVFHLI